MLSLLAMSLRSSNTRLDVYRACFCENIFPLLSRVQIEIVFSKTDM